LNRIIGIQTESTDLVDYKRIERLKPGELLRLNIGSTTVDGIVKKVKDQENKAELELKDPVCTTFGEKIAISRKIQASWRLIGWGKMYDGTEVE